MLSCKIVFLLVYAAYVFPIPCRPCRANTSPIDATVATLREHIIASPQPAGGIDVDRFLEPLVQVMQKQQKRGDFPYRLTMLSQGFKRYWDEQNVSQWDPNGVLIAQARLRWFVEDVMKQERMTASEEAIIKKQHQSLLKHALASLRGEFPFLESGTIDAVGKDLLDYIYTRIEIPFEPVYPQVLTEQQCSDIKSQWDSQFKRRYNLWYTFPSALLLGDSPTDTPKTSDPRHARFISICLAQHVQSLWNVGTQAPYYLVQTIRAASKSRKILGKAPEEIHTRLNNFHPHIRNPLEQIEVWGFIFSVLLEASKEAQPTRPVCYRQNTPSVQMQNESYLKQGR